MSKSEIQHIRESLHIALIKRLKEVYGKEVWRYTFIKNANEKYGYKVQYHQLKEFEKGISKNENIISAMLLEILSKDRTVKIDISSNRNIHINKN